VEIFLVFLPLTLGFPTNKPLIEEELEEYYYAHPI